MKNTLAPYELQNELKKYLNVITLLICRWYRNSVAVGVVIIQFIFIYFVAHSILLCNTKIERKTNPHN